MRRRRERTGGSFAIERDRADSSASEAAHDVGFELRERRMALSELSSPARAPSGANGFELIVRPRRAHADREKGGTMDHVYKSIELTGSSTGSVDEAIRAAIAKASKTLHNLRWFEVTNVRGAIEAGAVSHFQVTMKVGFTLDE
jgi:hypothetical protein